VEFSAYLQIFIQLAGRNSEKWVYGLTSGKYMFNGMEGTFAGAS